MDHTTTAAARPSRRRALVPLATLLAAAAIAMTTGATFISDSVNPGNVYETGDLEQTNSRASGSIFDLDNLKPGDSVSGAVTITNSGSLASKFTLTETVQANTFADKELLTLTVVEDGATVYSGRLGAAGEIDLGTWSAGEDRTFTFTAKLDSDAGNANQNKRAETTYTWDGVQTAATHTNQ
jgi:spore coat-associated protein N